jgi:enamine deaminase RidA (YjgF/YER057c/UK114 family)
MIFDQDQFDRARVVYSSFEGEESTEFNLIITPEAGTAFSTQLAAVEKALKLFLRQQELTDESVVFKRYFVSDYSNQCEIQERLATSRYQSAVSVVQQTPLSGAKVVLQATLLDGVNTQKFQDGNNLCLSRNGYSHLFSTQLHSENPQQNSFDQTTDIFQVYLKTLKNKNLRLEENCIRTWLYVRDIDNNYAGMVKSRNRVFDQHKLTKDTHFIASTGIEGRFSDPSVSVLMDAYAIGGIRQEQVKFLKALSHLNPTHEYGVAFERGTAVDYGDRRHIFISGTASIDNQGQIVHIGDILGQIRRTFENISALLADADASLDDLTHIIVYLRDIADYAVTEEYISRHNPEIPYVIVQAPVCRPGWLIEIEGIAIKGLSNPQYNNY